MKRGRLVLIIILVAVARSFFRTEPSNPAPEILFEVPSFSLLTPEGRAFGSEDLRGTVYVANFFFTRCPSICPVLMNGMAQLQERYRAVRAERIHLVSFTVDPVNDRPERLKEYAGTCGVDAARWTLLTGELESVRKLLVEGFRVAMGEPQSVGENLIDIAHTGKFVLVDPQGRIRGFYDYNQAGLDALFKNSLAVAKEKP